VIRRLAAGVSVTAGLVLLSVPAYADPGDFPDTTDQSGPMGLFILFAVIAAVIGIGGFLWRLSAARRIAEQAGLDPDAAVTTTLLNHDGLAATYLAASLRQQQAPPLERPVGHLDPPSSRRTTESRLAELKSLHADGLITDDDYDRRRAEILNAV
jgi:hypothetical protein